MDEVATWHVRWSSEAGVEPGAVLEPGATLSAGPTTFTVLVAELVGDVEAAPDDR